MFYLTGPFSSYSFRKDADKKSPLASTSETTSQFSPAHDLTVSFGFHDSGLGRRHFVDRKEILKDNMR